MSELNQDERKVLKGLIEMYQGDAVRGKDLSDQLGIEKGEVREIIRTLKLMGLVKGITGPNGGYVPLEKAYSKFSEVDVKDKMKVKRTGITYDIKDLKTDVLNDKVIVKLRRTESISNNDKARIVIISSSKSSGFIEGKVSSIDKDSNKVFLEIIRHRLGEF